MIPHGDTQPQGRPQARVRPAKSRSSDTEPVAARRAAGQQATAGLKAGKKTDEPIEARETTQSRHC